MVKHSSSMGIFRVTNGDNRWKRAAAAAKDFASHAAPELKTSTNGHSADPWCETLDLAENCGQFAVMTTEPLYTPEKLLKALADLGLKTSTLWHQAVFRVGEGDDIKAALPGAHTKNLFLKDDKGQLWLISAEQTTQINLKTLPKSIGSGRLSFGNEERLYAALGVTPGSVTALGLANDPEQTVKFLLDKRLYDADIVNFHPLTNTATTALSQDDFRKFIAWLGRDLVVIDFAALTA